MGKKAEGLFKPVENTYGVFYRQRPAANAGENQPMPAGSLTRVHMNLNQVGANVLEHVKVKWVVIPRNATLFKTKQNPKSMVTIHIVKTQYLV